MPAVQAISRSPVVVGDAEVDEQPRLVDGADDLAVDGHRGRQDALEHRSHGATLPAVSVVLRTAYVVYLATLLYLVWEPDASTPGGVVVVVADVLAGRGVPDAVRVVEVGLNVLLFVPLSLLGAFVLDRWRVVGWLLAGLALSLVVEGVQAVFLTGRSATVSDLLANTAGAGLGILAALVVRRRLAGVPRRSPADRMSP